MKILNADIINKIASVPVQHCIVFLIKIILTHIKLFKIKYTHSWLMVVKTVSPQRLSIDNGFAKTKINDSSPFPGKSS